MKNFIRMKMYRGVAELLGLSMLLPLLNPPHREETATGCSDLVASSLAPSVHQQSLPSGRLGGGQIDPSVPWQSLPHGEARRGQNTATPTTLLLTLTILLTLTACNNAPRQQLAAGNQAFDQSAYDRAAESYQTALELDPDAAESIYNLANTRYRQGIYTDTHQLLPQSAALGSEELATQSHFNQGNAHYQLEDWPAAVEAYKETLRLNPQDIDAKYNLELALRNIADQNQDQQNQDEQNQDEQNDEEQNEEQQDQEQQDQEQQNEEQQNQEQQSQDEQNQSEQNQEEQNEDQQNQSGQEPQEGDQQEQPQPSGEPQEGLTQEQARQLLRAVGQNTETLQEQMQQVLPAEGQPPEKDW